MGALYSKGVRRMSVFGLTETVESALAKEMDEQKLRYKPESLHLLQEQTHFTEKELKYLYGCFKQNCPSGYVSKQQFVQIFRSFFQIHRLSDATQYAELVFNTFDDDENGRISFSEFAIELSMFTKGTLEQRLDWLYDLYDSTRRGYLIEEDYFEVCRAMYAMVGVHFIKDKYIPIVLRRHVKHQFMKLDTNRDGKITRSEFVKACKADADMVQQLNTLRTYW